MTSEHEPRHTQGGGGYPPGGYGGPPPGGYGPPGSAGGGNPPGGYGPPGAPGGYGPPAPPYGMPYPPPAGPQWGAPGQGPNPALKKQAQTWLIIAAASFFLCTSCLGVVGAVFCYMAMQAADQGNLADAANKLKWGKILTIVGLLIGLLMTLGAIAYYFINIAGRGLFS